MTVISGVLKGPMGDARVGVVIELRAVKTSATVVNQARSQSVTNATGHYTLNVEPGAYDVMITASGRQPERVGGITVALNSQAGTLNDFLNTPGETDLNPEIVATVDRMRADAAKSAAAAKISENNAAAAMTNALSKVTTADQSVASTLLLAKPVRLSSASNATGFIPKTPGAWVAWNRKTASDDSISGGTDFINHKGTFTGGWNFWSTDGEAINLSTKINWDGSIRTMGGIVSYTDQIMQAGPVTPNLLLRFRDKDGIEKGAVYSQTDTGVINFRWGGTTFTMQGRTDGLISMPMGTIIASALSTPVAVSDAVTTIGSAPLTFRGADAASFSVPNNYSVGTWHGFSVVPTSDTSLSTGVEQGKPVFYVNARTGITYSLNGFGGQLINVSTDEQFYAWLKSTTASQFFRNTGSAPGSAPASSCGILSRVSDSYLAIVGDYNSSNSKILVTTGNNITSRTHSLWSDKNTTVDANGFIKKASPIVKLFSDGNSELNDQSQGVTTERISEGVYRISGTLGFNADAEWGGVDGGIEIPTDRNKLPLVWVDYEVDETGDLLIKTFHRINATAPKFAQNVKAGYEEGQPIDIPVGRWIDLRVEMPGVEEPEFIPEPEPEVVPDSGEESATE